MTVECYDIHPLKIAESLKKVDFKVQQIFIDFDPEVEENSCQLKGSINLDDFVWITIFCSKDGDGRTFKTSLAVTKEFINDSYFSIEDYTVNAVLSSFHSLNKGAHRC